MSTSLPRALFVSPTFPGGEKNGLSMRSAMWLKILSQKYQVVLLVIPIADGVNNNYDNSLADLCSEIHIVRPSFLRLFAWKLTSLFNGCTYTDKVLNSRYLSKVIKRVSDQKFDLIHIFRIYLTPVLNPFLIQSDRPLISLDIDDIESRTNLRLAELFKVNGFNKISRQKKQQSEFYQEQEKKSLMLFDQVFVCSNIDAEYLNKIGVANVGVVPNAVPAGQVDVKEVNTDRPFSFLFVGNYNYFPNQDGVKWFMQGVYPLIKQNTNQRFVISFVGSGALPNLKEFKKNPDIRVLSDVEDLTYFYNNADLVIAPIRAGGGTRIKIIEAFSFSLPVVSTSIGIEGLNVEHNVHAMIADTTEDFAEACLRLMNDSNLREQIVIGSAGLFKDLYLEEKVISEAACLI